MLTTLGRWQISYPASLILYTLLDHSITYGFFSASHIIKRNSRSTHCYRRRTAPFYYRYPPPSTLQEVASYCRYHQSANVKMEATNTNPLDSSSPSNQKGNNGTASQGTISNDKENKVADKNTNKKKTPNQKRPYRPGFNSYLKVVLDDNTLNQLHQCSLHFHEEIQKISQKENSNDEEQKQQTSPTHEASSSISNVGMIENGISRRDTDTWQEIKGQRRDKKNEEQVQHRQRRSMKYRPRSLSSLHMTLFFGGEIICEMPSNELVEWYTDISERLEKSRFIRKNENKSSAEVDGDVGQEILDMDSSANKSIGGANHQEHMLRQSQEQSNDNNDDPEYWFKVKEFILFPPRRNNLIVALLDASPSFHKLHNDIHNISSNGTSESLRNEVKRTSKGPVWKPHLTLGNLYNTKKADLNTIRSMLEAFSSSLSSSTNSNSNYDNSSDRNNAIINERCGNAAADIEESTATISKIKVKKITMGGPIPENVTLDWDFYLKPTILHEQPNDDGKQKATD